MLGNGQQMKALGVLGIDTRAEVQKALPAIPDLVQAGRAFGSGDIAAGVRELGQAAQKLPPEQRSAFIHRAIHEGIDALKLPAKLKGPLRAIAHGSADLLANPVARSNLSEALEALKGGKLSDFLHHMQIAVAHGGDNARAKVNLLNSLQHLPGSMGDFFKDERLNESIVKSGAFNEAFDAFKKLARGDLLGAVKEMAGAAGKLLTHGDKWSVGVWKLKKDLPIGEEGVKNFVGVMQRFIDALPDRLKAKIQTKALEVAKKSGLSSLPGKNVPALIGSGKDLVSDLRNKDWLGALFSGAKTALNAAGFFPPIKPLTTPLMMIVGLGEAVRDANGLVGDLGRFQDQLFGV